VALLARAACLLRQRILAAGIFSIAEKAGRSLDDGRSLSFLTEFAGATETMLVHTLWLLFPAYARPLAIIWTAIVLADAMRQIVVGYRLLS